MKNFIIKLCKILVIQIIVFSIIIGKVYLVKLLKKRIIKGKSLLLKFNQYFNNIKLSFNYSEVGFDLEFKKICKKIVAINPIIPTLIFTYGWGT